ncbi:hypothetical protein ES703_19999 [subsurface metagenome]
MSQKALTTETVEELRSLRSQGLTVREVAARVGVSEGAVSSHTRDLAKPRVKKEPVSSGRRESKDIMEAAARAKIDEETVDLANRVRKARLQQELDEVEDRKRQRQEIEDLRIRERKLMLQLDEARVGAGKGDSAVAAELTQLRGELGELREARHQAELRAIEDRHSAEVRRLEGRIALSNPGGLTEYDLLSKLFDKVENMVILGSGKVDRVVSRFQSDSSLVTALQLGLSPAEVEILKNGPEFVPTREDYELGRRYRAHREGVELTDPEPGEYEGIVAFTEQRNQRYEALKVNVSNQMQIGAVRQPAILKEVMPTDIVPVKCSFCGKEVSVDKSDPVIARSRAGKCPECSAIMDLTKLYPVEVKKAPGKGVVYE